MSMPQPPLPRLLSGLLWLSLWLSLSALFQTSLVQAQTPTATPRPLNVLFIVADDLNTNLGCYGHPLVQSPNIDRLARRGMRFDRAYCQFSLCNPSRTSFLSGKRPDSTGVFDNLALPRLRLPDAVFLPEYFKRHGYFSGHVGKILHTQPKDAAVDWDLAVYPASTELSTEDFGVEPRDNADTEEFDGRTAQVAVQLLEQYRDRPFFLGVGFYRPHTPLRAPRKYFDLYPPDRIQLPFTPPNDRADIPGLSIPDILPSDRAMTPEQQRQVLAGYYACTTFMDAQVGVILDALNRLGLSDHTVVVFFGDNGFMLDEHGGLWRKQMLFEEACHVPLIIAAPGQRAGAGCQRPVELVDLYPTLADLCHLPAPPGMEGASLVPLLQDPACQWQKGAYTVQRRPPYMGRAVRDERYRYSDWGSDATAELYDHANDPQEFTNLARDPAYAATLARMQSLLRGGPAANAQ